MSKEFQLFAEEWSFEQVTSSPVYPQSNGLAENAVKQAKKLLERSKRDGSDPMLGLLNLRNTPRNVNLGSPAQRLLSRRTRTVLPTTRKLLRPKVIPVKRVSQEIETKRQQQKVNYDKSAKPLGTLKTNQVVRIQTTKGYDKLGVIKQIGKEPRSYIVQSNGREYRRNRRHLLAVQENITKVKEEDSDEPDNISLDLDGQQASINTIPEETNNMVPDQMAIIPNVPTSSVPARCNSSSQQTSSQLRQHPITTRSGRISKPNSKYKDYVT